MPEPPRIAKAGEAAHDVATSGASRHRTASQRRSTDDPDAVLAFIREHIREGRIVQARETAAEGLRLFPDHAALANADRILAVGKATPSRGTEPSTDEEFEWLRDPPAWAHGKWVALVGSKAVAVADTLAEVMDTIRASDLPKKPLVHHIA